MSEPCSQPPINRERASLNDDASRWHGIYLYYYDEDKDDLLLDCVRPLFGALEATSQKRFFVRHWLRGPHVRLFVFTPSDRFFESVKPKVEEQIGWYLTEHPSATEIDGEQRLAAYQKLAEQEQETGALLPLRPNNSIMYEDYSRRLHVLGSVEAAGLLEAFYVETTKLTFEMLEHIRSNDDRLELSFDLMIAVAHVLGSGIARGFLSYRSHSEAFILNSSNPAALRTSCRERYETLSEALVQRLERVLKTFDAKEGDVPFVHEWVEISDRFWRQAQPLVASEKISFDTETGRGGRRWNPEMLEHSAFHQSIQNNDAYVAAMQKDLWFRCYRLVLNYLYLHLNRLGIKPLERYLLCYLLANAVEELFGVSAVDLVS